jgi:hypothetical protein
MVDDGYNRNAKTRLCAVVGNKTSVTEQHFPRGVPSTERKYELTKHYGFCNKHDNKNERLYITDRTVILPCMWMGVTRHTMQKIITGVN